MLPAVPALAHPHIFIDAKAVIVFDDTGRVTGIRHAWTFDEVFSAWSIQGLDTNGDGATSPEEMQDLANENITGLSEYEFYTFAGEGQGSNLQLASMAEPRLEYVEGKSTLRFGLAFDPPHAISDTLEIAVNDPEYYVSISYADASAVTLENAPQGCSAVLDPPKELDPALADQLYALGPDVTELPPELATAMRGVQGRILVRCPPGSAGSTTVANTALDAVTEVAGADPLPFGGPPREPGASAPRGGLVGWIAAQQKDFYAALTDALGRLRSDNTAFLLLGTLSFLYGVFHAAGPGHGKVVISSYVLANEQQLRRGVALSFASAMVQSAVAVIFVLVAALALNLTGEAMGAAANWFGVGSYALIALLGLWLITRKLFGFGHRHAEGEERVRSHQDHARTLLYAGAGEARVDQRHSGHDHGHRHDHRHEHGGGALQFAGAEHAGHHHVVTPATAAGNWREALGVVLAVGMRPCSGALVVLVFALSQGVLAAGIAAVFLMGLGTALTVAVLASLAVGAKGLAQRWLGRRNGMGSTVIWWAELAGAVAVFAFGALLLIASV